jgi:hypothetical protein
MIKAGTATEGGNGYPLWYEAKAEVILPFISQGPPPHEGPMVIGEDYVMPCDWKGKVKINQLMVESCSPDEDLIVVCWDQS